MKTDLKKVKDNILMSIDGVISNLIRLREELEIILNYLYTERTEPASSDQIRYLKILYKKAGEKAPDDIDKISREEASRRINELKRRLGWVKTSKQRD